MGKLLMQLSLRTNVPRRLTATDVCTVTGYSRDELHAILKVLWPYNEEKGLPRVAREFTARDLVVLSVTQTLERRFGLKRTALGNIGQHLRNALSGPKEVSKKARLAISIDPPSVEYISTSITERDGVVVALGPIFEKVDGYLTFDVQGVLPLGADIVSARAKTGPG
ncbi:hypothetical protein [Polaromonas sp. JS666]|uniref:hypothetical protein n=1 Tax=Polaromonas sp. (strain JS666 / ATCC BAA-500) TaxID=296591 RepID=UPI0009420234|nr:hypothetical protein [Polaromonas sp. JS666]